jgi:hypothetical protein
MSVAAPFLAILAGIPFLIGIYIESWVIAGLFDWDTQTVFLVQAVPLTVLAVLFAIASAAAGRFDD